MNKASCQHDEKLDGDSGFDSNTSETIPIGRRNCPTHAPVDYIASKMDDSTLPSEGTSAEGANSGALSTSSQCLLVPTEFLCLSNGDFGTIMLLNILSTCQPTIDASSPPVLEYCITLLGFVLPVAAQIRDGGITHFQANTSIKVGLTRFLYVLVQRLAGFIRPTTLRDPPKHDKKTTGCRKPQDRSTDPTEAQGYEMTSADGKVHPDVSIFSDDSRSCLDRRLLLPHSPLYPHAIIERFLTAHDALVTNTGSTPTSLGNDLFRNGVVQLSVGNYLAVRKNLEEEKEESLPFGLLREASHLWSSFWVGCVLREQVSTRARR